MKKRTILIFIAIQFISVFILNAPSTSAIIRDTTISAVAEKDTYVNSYNPASNFGGQDYALSGFYFTGDILESYFYFNFSDKPIDFSKAEISIDLWSVSMTMNVSICLIEENWDEYSMTWMNKPAKESEITSLLITQSDIYTFDVTDYIAGRNNLSICVYIKIENYVDDYFYITSREGFYSEEDAPQLIWTYPEDVIITVTNPTSTSNWQELYTYPIQWSTIGTIEKVKIELYKDATFIEEITYLWGYTDNDGEYDFYVSSMEDYYGTNYRIKITDYDDSSVYGYSDYFSINIKSGTITVTSPGSSSSWEAGTMHYINWVTTGNIEYVDIEIYKGTTLKYYIHDVYNFGSKLWTIDGDIEAGTDWRIKIINADDSSQYDWSDYFEIYKQPTISGYTYYVIISLIFIFAALIIRKRKSQNFTLQ